MQIDKHTYYIDRTRAKTDVLIFLEAHHKQFWVIQDDQVIAHLDIQGLHGGQMDFQSYLRQMKQEARSIEMHRFMTWHGVGEVA